MKKCPSINLSFLFPPCTAVPSLLLSFFSRSRGGIPTSFPSSFLLPPALFTLSIFLIAVQLAPPVPFDRMHVARRQAFVTYRESSLLRLRARGSGPSSREGRRERTGAKDAGVYSRYLDQVFGPNNDGALSHGATSRSSGPGSDRRGETRSGAATGDENAV